MKKLLALLACTALTTISINAADPYTQAKKIECAERLAKDSKAWGLVCCFSGWMSSSVPECVIGTLCLATSCFCARQARNLENKSRREQRHHRYRHKKNDSMV